MNSARPIENNEQLNSFYNELTNISIPTLDGVVAPGLLNTKGSMVKFTEELFNFANRLTTERINHLETKEYPGQLHNQIASLFAQALYLKQAPGIAQINKTLINLIRTIASINITLSNINMGISISDEPKNKVFTLFAALKDPEKNVAHPNLIISQKALRLLQK